MVLTIGGLLLSLAMLTVGAEVLVRGAVGVARAAGVSSLLTGLTVVAFGTSTPELATSLRATCTGHPEVAIGNAIGSNIFNLGVILGVAALVCPIPVHRRVIAEGAVPMVVVSVLPLMALATGGVLTRWQGAILLALLAAYVVRSYLAGRGDPERAPEDIDAIPIAGGARKRVWLNLVLIVAGLGFWWGRRPCWWGARWRSRDGWACRSWRSR